MSQVVRFRSQRFGPIEVDRGAVLQFPQGLLGLEDREWVVIATREDAALLFLQSVHTPELELLVAVPENFYPSYHLEVPDAELLALADGEELPLEVVCVVNPNQGELEDFTINLHAPLLINPLARRGLQAINSAQGFDQLRAPLWGAVDLHALQPQQAQLPTLVLGEASS